MWYYFLEIFFGEKMKNKEFENILDERTKKMKKTLSSKGKEYSGEGTDRLHNFKVAARKRNTTPEDALMGMKVKHDVSLDDIIDNMKKGIMPPLELLEEKIGDEINYWVLLEAVIKERIRQVKENDNV